MTYNIYRYPIIAIAFAVAMIAYAQDTLRTHITYDAAAETALGTGSYTAYQLVTNRHHTLATRPNTASLRGALTITHALSPKYTLEGKADVIASLHADHSLYLQQAYINLHNRNFFVEVGTRENQTVMREADLSVGSFAKGTNAKPVPQFHFGTNGFWTVPYTNGWLQINGDFGYGHMLDAQYTEDTFRNTTGNSFYTTGKYYHQKHLFFRSNPTKRFFGVIGIEHVAFFGGTRYEYQDGALVSTNTKPANLKAFMSVILPLGDGNYFENNANEDWVYGNHLGMMTYQIGWNVNSHHQLSAYLDNIFEDGSGIRKGNGWDGLWGIEYKNSAPGRQYVRGIVMEYFQTTNQGGPLHWDPNDYPSPAREQITSTVTGCDNYYNHMFYAGYAHYGMTPGIALLTSPIYNHDGSVEFHDNRVLAWHLGIKGDLTDRLSYLVRGSYREGKGTYYTPISLRHSFDAMMQCTYTSGAWRYSAAYAFDKGNIYGDCSTFNFKIAYHGKIF